MKVVTRTVVIVAALAASALSFGFVIFATMVTRDQPAIAPMADGIVVLTGGEARIQAGARLLKEGHGKRLLISGVNRRTTKEAVERISGLDHKSFLCCVDLGYEARDTVGNADETRTWAKTHDYKRLVIVTSSYHMPRSLTELALVMPDAELLPYAVTPSSFPDTGWWLNVATTRLLLSEYLKFLPAAARLSAQRLIGRMDDRSVALERRQNSDS
ncbi:MAG: YdcF family protein [Hyphomicrobium sp.]